MHDLEVDLVESLGEGLVVLAEPRPAGDVDVLRQQGGTAPAEALVVQPGGPAAHEDDLTEEWLEGAERRLQVGAGLGIELSQRRQGCGLE